MKKNCSKEELIVRKSTARFTVKQERFSNRRKGKLYMDRVLERTIIFLKEKHVYSKGSGSQVRMIVQKSKASSTMKKKTGL